MKKTNPISIKFDIDLNDNAYFKDKTFIMNLNITVNFLDEIYSYENIAFGIDSMQQLIEYIDKYIAGEIDYFYYTPLEEDFAIFERPPKVDMLKIIKEMEDLPHYKDSLKELKEIIEEKKKIINLIFLIDNCKYLNGFSTGTGMGFCIQISLNQLKEFRNNVEQKLVLINQLRANI